MNIFLQIGCGLLPGTIVAIILLIKRRAFNIKKIFLTLMLTVGCGTLISYGVLGTINSKGINSHLSQKKMIAFANALVEEGAYSEAVEVVEQYSKEYGYNNECRLLYARVALLQDNYESAAYLYDFLCENTNLVSAEDEEVLFAKSKAQHNSSDLVMIEYLKSLGEDLTEYGFSETDYEDLKTIVESGSGDIKRDIKDAIENKYSISEEALNCAEAVAGISKSYTDLLNNEEGTSTSKYRRAFNEIEVKAAEYLSLECVNKARIKAYVIAKDYDAITEKLNDNSSYHELMIAAELYMSGLVRKSDFSDSYQEINVADASAVKTQLNKIYQNNQKDLTIQEKKSLKARVTAVSKQLDDPALVTIKEQLTTAAENEAGSDQTKVYLELAKIEDYFGNETSTDTFLSTAIYSSQENEDDNYVAAMSQIITVISNDEDNDTENIKNVSEYVDSVLDHSLTVNVEKIVSPQYNTEISNSIEADDDVTARNFAQAAVDYVSRVKSSISIGRIDTSNFDIITARVQIDSNYLTNIDELKTALKVYDCGAEINSFTVKKINYTGSNIILVCDVSGSMGGSIQDLRDAVVTFINDKNQNESLSIVTFNDSIVETKSFGTPDDSLIAFAEGMSANGGTDMFSAVVNCLGSFSAKDDENNVLILMTDGQDNNPKSTEEIYEEIGGLALAKGVTVYTMGLGADVDTLYLSTIAGSGNGKFVYVSDSSSLTFFYDMLHSQVYSQYEISYKAQDTITMQGRTLEVTLPSENLRDIKSYNLKGADDSNNSLNVSQDLSVSGMSPKYVYKGLQDISVKLKGTGFKSDSKITVKLNGNIDYTVEATYVDQDTYTIVVPASVAVGTYNVEVTIDGKKKVLQNGFSVIVQGDEKKTAFGPYVFTSAEKIEDGNEGYTLRGFVTLNGWLHFKGDVKIAGDLVNGGSIRVSDYSGSYVEYDDATSEGIGSVLSKKGIPIDIPALYDFTLYNDQANLYDYTKYQVDDISTGLLEVYNLVKFDSPVIRLYPNSIGLYYSTGTTILPYQEQILKVCGNTTDLFEFTWNGSAQITNKNVGIVLDVSYKDPSKSNYIYQVNLLNSPVYFNGEFKVEINTLKNEYTVGAMVGLEFFSKESGLGAEISWKSHLVPDSVKLSMELAQAVKLPTTVPIEVNNFTFEVSDINEVTENGQWASLKFTGSADFSSVKVKEYFPALEKFLGDISFFEMPDTTASVRVSPFTMEATAKLIFLSEIELAEAGVKLGNFDYSNALLQLDDVNMNGLSASLKQGFMWNSANERISVDISGTGELDAHTRFVGVIYTGTAAYDFSWWLINTERSQSGTVALGLYTTHDEKNELIFRYRTQDSNGKVNGNFYYIDENGRCGKNNGVLN